MCVRCTDKICIGGGGIANLITELWSAILVVQIRVYRTVWDSYFVYLGGGVSPRHEVNLILFCFCRARYSLLYVVTTLCFALVLFGFAFAVVFKARRRRNAFRRGLLLLTYPELEFRAFC
jgi:hypothetical protein